MIPRMWAFEITVQGIVVYSKLMCKQWPHVPSVARKVSNLLAEMNEGKSHVELAQKYQIDFKY